MRARGALAAVVLVGLVALGLVLQARAREDDDEGASATLELRAVNPGGPAGVAALTRADGRRRGPLVAYGFAPGTRHRVEASPSCALRGEQVAELVADPNGVAFARLDLPDDAAASALTVLGGSQATSPRVACGGPGTPELRPRDVALVGPGAAARAATSTLIQLQDGRAITGGGTIVARAGDEVAVGIRADRPDEVTFAGLGLTQQVGPGAIARLSLRPRRPGRYPVVSRLGGEVAALVVR